MASLYKIRSLIGPAMFAAALSFAPCSLSAQQGGAGTFLPDAVQPPKQLEHLRAAVPAGEGQAQSRHAMSLGQVLASVKPAEQVDASGDTIRQALPEQAQRLVEEASRQIEQVDFFNAVRTLREAEAISPGHHAVLRGLGVAYTLSGNRVRGAAYLEQAIQQQPDDPAALFLLAKHNAARGDLPKTLAYLNAWQGDEPASALMAYTRYAALRGAGYTQAASASLKQCLALLDASSDQPADQQDLAQVTPLIKRELAILNVMQPELAVQLADLHLKLEQWDQAQQLLDAIDVSKLSDVQGLSRRRVYLALRRGELDLALKHAADQLERSDRADVGRAMADYLAAQGVGQARIADAFDRKIQAGSVSLALLTGLAQIAEPAELRERVVAWLKSAPQPPDAYREVAALLVYEDDRKEGAVALASLFQAVLGEMRRDPDRASQYVEAVLDAVDAPICTLRALKQPGLTQEAQGDPHVALLRAVAYEKAGRSAQAAEAYKRVLAEQPGNAVSIRVPLAKLLIELGDISGAIQTLDPIGAAADWEVFEVMMLALGANGQPSQAIQFVDNWRGTNGVDIPSALLRAELVAMTGNPARACNDIFRLIDETPADIRIYEAGLDLVARYRDQFRSANFADSKRIGLVNHMQANLPDAPRSRIETATEIYRRQLDQPNAAAVERAVGILRSVTQADPKNELAWFELQRIYFSVDQLQLADEAFRSWFAAGPPTIWRTLSAANLAITNGEKRRAEMLLRRLLALEEEDVLPGQPMNEAAAGMLVSLLSTASSSDAENEAVSLRMLKRFPDGVQINNTLGYQWSLQDKNLLQAKAMIERALKGDAANYTLLDSLAWVQYKLGDYQVAADTQKQALTNLEIDKRQSDLDFTPSTAVLNDHMGDIQFRNGDANAAVRHWQIALGVSARLDADRKARDPELGSLAQRVADKIDAVQKGQDPPIAPIPGPEAHGPAGHPAD